MLDQVEKSMLPSNLKIEGVVDGKWVELTDIKD